MAATFEQTPSRLEPGPTSVPAGGLDLDDIQGDVLIGLQKKAQIFTFFQIADSAAFKNILRSSLLGKITSSAAVHAREFMLQGLKANGTRSTIPNIGFNIAFTRSGITTLLGSVVDLGDAAFAEGAASRAAAIGDPATSSVPNTWLPEFAADTFDGVLNVTGGSIQNVQLAMGAIIAALGPAIKSHPHQETGALRPGLEEGHEHFGWLDGVSQPAISGLTIANPGQDELDPGVFLFGVGNAPTPTQPWMKNGSLMVFRRLKQLVPEFHDFVASEASRLQMDSALLGARLVGRWKSGAPLTLSPFQDDQFIAADPAFNNNFDNADDQSELRCPFGAHIRKMNPRADLPDIDEDLRPHRIIRAGIPFGPEVSSDEQKAKSSGQTDRGLLFVCYQRSIEQGFEFLQQSWASSENFVSPAFPKTHSDGTPVTVGIDPIIGRPVTASASMDEPAMRFGHGAPGSQLSQSQSYVVPTGGVYLFVPSITALQTVFS